MLSLFIKKKKIFLLSSFIFFKFSSFYKTYLKSWFNLQINIVNVALNKKINLLIMIYFLDIHWFFNY